MTHIYIYFIFLMFCTSLIKLISDCPFDIFLASRSGDLWILCSSEALCETLWSSKFVTGPVGLKVRYNTEITGWLQSSCTLSKMSNSIYISKASFTPKFAPYSLDLCQIFEICLFLSPRSWTSAYRPWRPWSLTRTRNSGVSTSASDSQQLMTRWKYQLLYDHWSQASWAQTVFSWIKPSGELGGMLSNQDIRPACLMSWLQNPSKPIYIYIILQKWKLFLIWLN